MNTRLIVSAFATILLSSIAVAGDLRVTIGGPVVTSVYYRSGMAFHRSNIFGHHHHRRYYAENNDRPYEPYRGQFVYTAPVVIYQQPNPIDELRVLCAPTVARVCSGSICVFCN